MKMTDIALKTGDLVWAKMKGFTPWPGMISNPPFQLRKGPKKNVPSQCVYFFGSKNYAWIEDSNIKPYLPFRDDLCNASKTVGFREAMADIEEYIQNPDKFDLDDNKTHETRDLDADFNKLREKSASLEEVAAAAATTKSPPPQPLPTSAETVTKKPRKFVKRLRTIIDKSKSEKRESKVANIGKRKRNTVIPMDNGRIDFDFNNYTPCTSSTRNALLDRPTAPIAPVIREIDLTIMSDSLKEKNIIASKLTFGFLGLGIMGSAVVKNFLMSGHKVVVWNRSSSKCKKFIDAGAQFASTPSDVVDLSDIIFSCVGDVQASKDLVFGNCGILHSQTLSQNKGYVELSTLDPDTSKDISEAIMNHGGRYLEAQLQGSKEEAEEGTLVILAAGDRTIFNDCQSCFEAIGKNSFFLGDVGNGCKINLIIQTMIGVSLVGLSEGMSLADRFGISIRDILEIVELTAFSSGMVLKKGKEMATGDFAPEHPLTHMQKDMKLALTMAQTVDHPMVAAAVSNEVFKHAKRLGYGDHDDSAVYVRARF